MEFDFDAWAKLAKEDPAGFERQREAALRATIAAAPPEFRQRLEGLQFRLDLERQRASTPLGATVRLNSLMWAGLHRLRKELNSVSQDDGVTIMDKPSAEIIPMHTSKRREPRGEG